VTAPVVTDDHVGTNIYISGKRLLRTPWQELARLWLVEYNSVATSPEVQCEPLGLAFVACDDFPIARSDKSMDATPIALVRGLESGIFLLLVLTTDGVTPRVECRPFLASEL
jgi:hypothetical protein